MVCIMLVGIVFLLSHFFFWARASLAQPKEVKEEVVIS